MDLPQRCVGLAAVRGNAQGCRAAETSSGHKKPVPRGDGWLMCTTLARRISRGKFAYITDPVSYPGAGQCVSGLPACGASVVADLEWEL
jgi:hypothetical protein